jgi:putative peptidoglycan lipid II flippase
MFKRLITVSGFTALSRVTGFLRDIMMSYIMGAGAISDAFLVAFRLPNNFRSIFGEGAFDAAFLPRFAKSRTLEGEAEAARFADQVYSWQMAAQAVLLVAALACMGWIVAAMAPGFARRPGEMELATNLARIAFPYLIMTVVAVQLSAMLNAIGKFAAAASWSIFLNIAMIAALFLAKWFPNAGYAAAWGVFAAGVLQYVFIISMAARSGLKLHIRRPRLTREMRNFFLAFGAATIGSASVQISLFIDNLIASFLPSGDLSALYYADRINQLPMGVLGVALGTVLLPAMSNLLAKDDRIRADAEQNRAAVIGLMLTLPFVAVFVLIPQPIIHAVFDRGAFHLNGAATLISAAALTAYSVGLPAFVLIRVVAATFYARGDTRTPVRATMTAMAVNIALKFVLVWGLDFGAAGIALGTALGAWVNVGLLTTMARRRKLLTISPVFTRALLPAVLAALAAGAGAWFGLDLGGRQVAHPGILHALAEMGGALGLGTVAYLAVVVLFHRRLPLGRLGKN